MTVTELLNGWEEVHKKGQMSLWIFLAIKDQPRYVPQIQEFIRESTHGHFDFDQQSLYRSLRKLEKIGMVTYQEVNSPNGPDRKLYELTSQGREVFQMFVDRNIKIYLQPQIVKLLFTHTSHAHKTPRHS